ncbi:hypothetical protein K493DRAFT_301770 [Basidiobolus meristosporus CBS 931.73]|uniref:C2H2-type domain-containing protein n=1 Tax=Basidiobolus meristosporus CBS 931.73 TaxID=1314790 RepID=A0A1Y1YAV4_9FUNG|nr:hypothetical protein K493DRAFT_301770 [Basidiobolus meristosporus CBS 931.73]|eukprot:ORX94896.1 hypothetical protein K493DRAFT_301770 [Basidiobolus meristosporus CBS 931.73]
MVHAGEDHSTSEQKLVLNFREERKSSLSITTSDGQIVSLLNDDMASAHSTSPSPSPSDSTPIPSPLKSNFSNADTSSIQSRRKYKCNYPGCFRSFTTSGHLARHNRIHTGEKNFPCLMPGCPSRFSRQDNMMQHYRTHMSSKSRRGHRRSSVCSDTSKDSHNHQGAQGDVNYFFFEHTPAGVPRSFPSTPTDDRFHLPKLPSIQERRMSVDTAALPRYSHSNFQERFLPPADMFCFDTTNSILNVSRQHLDRTKPIG